MSSNMNDIPYRFWDEQRGTIRSRKGGWVVGKGVFSHGYSLLDELLGKFSYMQVVMLNATGRMPEREIADWFEAIHICFSWPDPRVWCNQVGALGGTMRASVVAAATAGTLAADAKAYGMQTLIPGMRFIQAAMLDYKRGLSAAEIVQEECAKNRGRPKIMGYARPVAKRDDRVGAMRQVQRELGLPEGEHQRLAYEIEEILLRDFDEAMNLNAYVSAFLADQGYTAEEGYGVAAVLVSSGVTACYTDTFGRPPESFLPLRCEDIEYTGKPPRSVP